VMAMLKEAELQKMQNEVLQEQVKQLKAMVSEVRDCMRLFPVPAREPERMVVLNQGDFLRLSPTESAFRVLQSITKEASLKWQILSLVNFIGGNTQFTAAGYMPSSSDKDAYPTSPGGALESDQLAVDLCGLTTPRKTSQCQHVIAREKELVYRGAENGPEFADPPKLMAASKVDPVLASFLEQMQSNQNPLSHARGDSGKEKALEIALSYLKAFEAAPETRFYAGVPIRVDGAVIGSFCIFGPRAPKGFGQSDLAEMRRMAGQAAAALEAQLEEKRREAAAAFLQEEERERKKKEKKKARNKKNRKKKGKK